MSEELQVKDSVVLLDGKPMLCRMVGCDIIFAATVEQMRKNIEYYDKQRRESVGLNSYGGFSVVIFNPPELAPRGINLEGRPAGTFPGTTLQAPNPLVPGPSAPGSFGPGPSAPIPSSNPPPGFGPPRSGFSGFGPVPAQAF